MKKYLLLLVSLLTTATVWAQEYTPIQFGENGPYDISFSEPAYLSFTPEATDYYVFTTFSEVSHSIAIELSEFFFEGVESEPAPFGGIYGACYGLGQKLNAGETYHLQIQASEYGSRGMAYIKVDKGYLVSPDAESADLANVLTPLPTAAYEGQEVKLTNRNGAIISNLTATANGEPIEVTADGTGMVYTFTMPAADVVLSGSVEIPTLQLGDNEISNEVYYAFTPAESGAYVFSSGTVDVASLLLGNDYVSMGFGFNGQTLAMGAMLEANATYTIQCMIPDGTAIMNVAKLELTPITVGENEIYAVGGIQYFEYPFTPPVSGDYTFSFTCEESLNPEATLLLGEDMIAQCSSGELSFTATLEAGTTYSLRMNNRGSYNVVPIQLTVVSPPLPSFSISIPESFEHGTVECDKETADYGETVTLTVTPDEGYELENLTVTIASVVPSGISTLRLRGGETIELTPGENGTYTFEMPAAPVTVNATFRETGLTGVIDINAAHPKTGRRYNLMGQPVGKDYKGIVIQDGKKLIVR